MFVTEHVNTVSQHPLSKDDRVVRAARRQIAGGQIAACSEGVGVFVTEASLFSFDECLACVG